MKHKRNHYIFYCIIGLMIFLIVYEEMKSCKLIENFTDEEQEQINKNVSDVVSLRKNVCKKADLVELDRSLDKLNEKMLTVKQKADDKKQKSGQRIS